jgi:four helix bundle protein
MKRPENIIVIKTEAFADRIIKMCRYLHQQNKGEKDSIRQIYRSGTSVGSNTA